jgi:hypothetical protein
MSLRKELPAGEMGFVGKWAIAGSVVGLQYPGGGLFSLSFETTILTTAGKKQDELKT